MLLLIIRRICNSNPLKVDNIEICNNELINEFNYYNDHYKNERIRLI